MSVVIPGIEGKLGSTKYYQCIMKADELVRAVRPAKEIDGWASMSIGEKMQRRLNTNRIKNQIVQPIRWVSTRSCKYLILDNIIFNGDNCRQLQPATKK